MIEIHGLTGRQRMLCDLMWSCSELSELDSLISSLPREDQRDCESLKIIIVHEALETTYRDKQQWDLALTFTKALCNRFSQPGKYKGKYND